MPSFLPRFMSVLAIGNAERLNNAERLARLAKITRSRQRDAGNGFVAVITRWRPVGVQVPLQSRCDGRDETIRFEVWTRVSDHGRSDLPDRCSSYCAGRCGEC